MIRKERRNESLCEKSMLLVANIIKISSSLSFAKMGHGSTAGRHSATESPAVPQIPGSKRLQEPHSRSKPIYVTKPGGGTIHGSPKYSSYVIHEERDLEDENVDGWASKYIEKVHRKNRNDLDELINKPYSHVTSRKVATVLN